MTFCVGLQSACKQLLCISLYLEIQSTCKKQREGSAWERCSFTCGNRCQRQPIVNHEVSPAACKRGSSSGSTFLPFFFESWNSSQACTAQEKASCTSAASRSGWTVKTSCRQNNLLRVDRANVQITFTHTWKTHIWLHSCRYSLHA